MTTVIEDANSVTELELKNITPFLDKDFNKQFNFNHLVINLFIPLREVLEKQSKAVVPFCK